MFAAQNNIPKRKLGVETPNVESNTIKAESLLLLETAAVIPSAIPTMNARLSEMNNKPALVTNVSRTRLNAGRFALCQ